MKCEAPQSMSSGNRLTDIGTFHLVITNVEPETMVNGDPRSDCFTFEADVLAGTVPGCEGKTVKETIFGPDLSKDEESQSWSKRKVFAYGVATDLVDPKLLASGDFSFDETLSVGKQIIVEFKRQMKQNQATKKWDIETEYIQISYANIYHVDDPAVKDIPKNVDAMQMRDTKRDAAWFAPLRKAGSDHSPAMAGAGVGSSSIDLPDDL